MAAVALAGEGEGGGRQVDAQHAAKEASTAPIGIGGTAALPADRASLYAMSAYTRMSDELADAVFVSYRLSSSESLQSWVELQGGLSNSNFLFVASSGRRLLCKVCDEKSVSELHRQIVALLLLQRHGLQLAYPVQRTDLPALEQQPHQSTQPHPDPTRYLLSLASIKPVVMYDFLDGRPPRSASRCVLQQLAHAQAALHCVDGSAFTFLPSFPMGMEAILPFIEQQLVGSRALHGAAQRLSFRCSADPARGSAVLCWV